MSLRPFSRHSTASRHSIAVLAATNLPDVVDSAVVRRFNLLVPFTALAAPQIEALLQSVLKCRYSYRRSLNYGSGSFTR